MFNRACLTFCFAVFPLAFAVCQDRPDVPLEEINDHYTNCRGINFLPTYPSLNQTHGYDGVASTTAMWYYYDTGTSGTWAAVDKQLRWLRLSGFNTVRVFLSFPAWEYFDANPTLNQIPGTNDSVRRYEHFLELCKINGIWCTPVLWDETLALGAPEPVQGTVFGNLGQWHTSPGESRMTSDLLLDPTLVTTKTGSFVADFANASLGKPAMLFWHLMNEPAAPEALVVNFLSATLGILDSIAPNDPTLLLAVWGAQGSTLSQMALDSRVDLMEIHPYGSTRGAIESQVYDSTHFPDPSQPSGFVRKAIIATEIGSPGFGWSYQDAVRYALGVPRPDLGPTETGVGFMPWVSNIGWKNGNYPFKESNGLFYGDGKVRETASVMAFVQAALGQGVSQSTLWVASDLVENTATADPLSHISQTPIPMDLDSFGDLVTLLNKDPLTFDWNDYVRATVIFANSGHVTAYLAGSTNGNPYGMVGVPYRGDAPTQFLLINFLPSIAIPGSAQWPAVVAASEALCGTTFSTTEPCHLYFLGTQGIEPWQNLLGPFVIGQSGPY